MIRTCSTLRVFPLRLVSSSTVVATPARLNFSYLAAAQSKSPSFFVADCGAPSSTDDRRRWLLAAPNFQGQRRHARRTVARQREIVDFLRVAGIRLRGLISADTRALIAKRRDHVLSTVADTRERVREKVRKKIVVMRENIWTLPNILCWARIGASPYLGYLILTEEYRLALILFGIAGLSDVADGYIARTFTSQRTQFGSFLDPAADKVLAAFTFLPLAFVGLIPWYLATVVIGRDVCLVTAGFYVRYKSLPPPITFKRFFEASRVTAQLKPTKLSKGNTGLQLLLIVSTLAAYSYGVPDPEYLPYLCNLTLATTLASGIDYAVRARSTYKLFPYANPGSWKEKFSAKKNSRESEQS